MRTIHKHVVSWYPGQTIGLQYGCRILCAQMQRKFICIWVECDMSMPVEQVPTFVVGTGQEVPVEAVNYVGTVQAESLVLHVYTGAVPL